MTDIAALDQIKEHIARYDRLVGLFNMEIKEVSPGSAIVSMTVGNEHLNAAGLCHGGAIFSLADVAFALACNSHGVMALALEISVNYLRPAKAGEVLTAFAREINLGNSTGLYSIEVKNQDSKLLAFFKATAYRFQDKSVLNPQPKESRS